MTARLEIVMSAIGHYYCDDCFYSCPLAPDGCCDDRYADDECNCGLEAKAQRVLDALDAARAPEPPKEATP